MKSKKPKLKFISMLGGTWIEGRAVFAYEHNSEVVMMIKTPTGRIVSDQTVMTRGYFDSLMMRLRNGSIEKRKSKDLAHAAMSYMSRYSHPSQAFTVSNIKPKQPLLSMA